MTSRDRELPFVDDHHVLVAASPEVVWAAARGYADSALQLGARHPLARVLGTEPRSGFAIEREDAPRLLALAGRHRFSRYRLTFEISGDGDDETSLVARTHAAFPGAQGRLYRAVVISSGLHGVAVRRMLHAIRRASLAS